MPAIYAHYSFGERVLSTLPPILSENIRRFKEAFALGTQGPDILFYHHPIKKNPTRKKGSDLHFLSAESFFLRQAKRLLHENLIKVENGTLLPNSAEASYVAGFLCHFVLDVFAHPIVYALQATGISHGKIESEFDKFLLRKDQKPIRGYNAAQFVTKENGTDVACANVLDVSLEEAQLSIKTMRKINGWFSHKCEAFHGLAHVILTLGRMERKFGDMFLHKKDDPRCKECKPLLDDTLESAIPFASTLIKEYFNDLPKIAESGVLNDFFQNNYTGGSL